MRHEDDHHDELNKGQNSRKAEHNPEIVIYIVLTEYKSKKVTKDHGSHNPKRVNTASEVFHIDWSQIMDVPWRPITITCDAETIEEATCQKSPRNSNLHESKGRNHA